MLIPSKLPDRLKFEHDLNAYRGSRSPMGRMAGRLPRHGRYCLGYVQGWHRLAVFGIVREDVECTIVQQSQCWMGRQP